MSFRILPSSYLCLPERFYQKLGPTLVAKPQLLFWNEDLAKELGIADEGLSSEEKALIFSGKKIMSGTTPIAQAYAGHQFGHFTPQLGDGRARLLGEVVSLNQTSYEVHLKGSGPTAFSRRGDGLATLDSALRELIVSEGMRGLGVPTTRALAVIGTGEIVFREREFPGAILVRTGASHVRVGTFEYFAARGDLEALKLLADEAIRINKIQEDGKTNRYVRLYEQILQRQAELVSHWMRTGFVHGVMNTDNTAISGETIDYGPCAFMEAYDPLAVWSSIDHHGRYAYGRQPKVLQWNLGILGYCLLPLFSENKAEAEKILEQKLSEFENQYHQSWLSMMGQKLGLQEARAQDQKLIEEYLTLLHQHKVDFTLGFRHLRFQIQEELFQGFKGARGARSITDFFFQHAETKAWIQKWRLRLQQEEGVGEDAASRMDQKNPILIPRNHQVEKAIRAASDQEDFQPLKRLLEALKNPFVESKEFVDLQVPAKPEEKVCETFCGT